MIIWSSCSIFRTAEDRKTWKEPKESPTLLKSNIVHKYKQNPIFRGGRYYFYTVTIGSLTFLKKSFTACVYFSL